MTDRCRTSFKCLFTRLGIRTLAFQAHDTQHANVARQMLREPGGTESVRNSGFFPYDQNRFYSLLFSVLFSS